MLVGDRCVMISAARDGATDETAVLRGALRSKLYNVSKRCHHNATTEKRSGDMANADTTTTPTRAQRIKTKGTTIAAWALTLMYLVFGAFLFQKFVLGDGPDKNWERALVIFNAVSAIGYAAVGVLLGTTVQQVNVANAKKEADKAKASEAKLADRSNELVQAAQDRLSKTSGLKALQTPDDVKLWSGTLGDSDEQLRQAIRQMNKALAERP